MNIVNIHRIEFYNENLDTQKNISHERYYFLNYCRKLNIFSRILKNGKHRFE